MEGAEVNTVFSFVFIYFPLLNALVLSFGSAKTKVARKYLQTVLVATAIVAIIDKYF